MRNILHSFINWLFDKSQYISAISFIVLTIIDISNLNESTISIFGIEKLEIGKIFYYFLVVIAIVFAFFSIQQSKELETLENDVKNKGNKIVDLEEAINNIIKDMDELFNSYLRLLLKNINFTHHDRISVYKVLSNRFVLLGRTSENPNLMSKGRDSYNIEDGFIGKGWAEGSFFIDDLPDPNHNNCTRYFNKVNSISKIDKEVLDNMKMKSRTFYVYRLDGFDGTPRAIVVFESLCAKGFKKEDIEELISNVKQPLIMFVEKNNKHKYTDRNELGL